MLTKRQARALVESELLYPDLHDPKMRLQIVDELTIEQSWGWVFFCQSGQYLESGKLSEQLAGNVPFIVNKHTGELVPTGTAWPIQKYIEDYEKELPYSR